MAIGVSPELLLLEEVLVELVELELVLEVLEDEVLEELVELEVELVLEVEEELVLELEVLLELEEVLELLLDEELEVATTGKLGIFIISAIPPFSLGYTRRSSEVGVRSVRDGVNRLSPRKSGPTSW